MTGQNKIEFEAWYLDDYLKLSKNNYFRIAGLAVNGFYEKRLEEKKGVIIAYYDSVGLFLFTKRVTNMYLGLIQDKKYQFYKKTRLEAFKEIEKLADQLRNEQLDKNVN